MQRKCNNCVKDPAGTPGHLVEGTHEQKLENQKFLRYFDNSKADLLRDWKYHQHHKPEPTEVTR